MEQLLLHLVGDYVTQTHRMAMRKTSSWLWALLHASVYSLPFVLIIETPVAWLAIWWTHALIDRYRLARFVCWAKNYPDGTLATGYPLDTPPFLSVWLLIACDNTLHLAINYAALRWL